MRKFECPFCNYVRNFYGREAKRSRKRVAGFTCPKCGKKVTDDDIKRKKGRGPKPKGERRKRVKKEVVKEIPKAVVRQPYVEQLDWKTREPPPPTERTLEEVIVEAFLSNPKRRRRNLPRGS